ncbi:MAG: dephospho-CoA kinase [Candidatus Eisenbacteria bacterium]|nr:dephospho-CoA kinase [Candidatus Latescibacterota bacterium]MBD3303176.1 dephospho-CoA kinase [Candidatus Eisenbacteria bacterium]
MRVVGVVGRTGCGKTALCEILAARPGCARIDADRLGHEALRDRVVRREVVGRFGSAILGRDGEIDRPALARIVFADEAALEALNALVHPWIVARINRQLADLRASGCAAIVLIDAALLLDWRDAVRCDHIVLVRCSEETSMTRLRDRGFTAEEARLRMERQLPEQVLRREADAVVDNDGDRAALAREAERLWAWLQRGEEKEPS